ncbi:hypothetical protein FXO38_35246 [Capsicum annuum]|nr:hypothetical protein FXO38_35246 [Capsicum annuum]
MMKLLYNQKLQAACPVLFDEAKLWKGQSEPELKQQIQKQFWNIRNLQNNEFIGPFPLSFKSLNELKYLDLSFNSLFGAIPEAVNNSLNYIISPGKTLNPDLNLFKCCSDEMDDATMECVGCEKCRLWGKLQVLGLETALKILFSVDGVYRHDQHGIIVWARTSLSALASFSLRSNLCNSHTS